MDATTVGDQGTAQAAPQNEAGTTKTHAQLRNVCRKNVAIRVLSVQTWPTGKTSLLVAFRSDDELAWLRSHVEKGCPTEHNWTPFTNRGDAVKMRLALLRPRPISAPEKSLPGSMPLGAVDLAPNTEYLVDYSVTDNPVMNKFGSGFCCAVVRIRVKL